MNNLLFWSQFLSIIRSDLKKANQIANAMAVKQALIISDCRPYLPVMVIGGENHAGAGVCIAGYPGTVNSKHHQQHQHQHRHNVFDIGAQSFFCFFLLRHMFPHFACLNKHKCTCYGNFYHPWHWNPNFLTLASSPHLIIQVARVPFVILITAVFYWWIFPLHIITQITLKDIGEGNCWQHTDHWSQSEHQADHHSSKVNSADCIQSNCKETQLTVTLGK